jgi:hypothetical protein
MSNSRYYLVGNHEVWVVQFSGRGRDRDGSRREVIEFAIGAAQNLGMKGECAHVCVLDDDGRLQCKWTYDPNHRSSINS